MADFDLDDIDVAPTKPQSRPARFAPKGSKLTKVKTEPISSSDSVLPEPRAKKEELDSKPILISSHIPKSKLEEEGSTCDVLQMDVDINTNDGNKEHYDEPMDSEGGDDEVVREIDVYLTPSTDPNTKLYVLQYPLRPKWRPYELEERCEEVRVKPASSEVEVDLAIDIESKNYDSNADPAVKMTKQTLATSWKPTLRSTGYAVGVLVGNKLHLNPIHAVVQLRPSMRHLTPSGSNLQTSTAENLDKKEGIKEQKPPVPSKKLAKPLETMQDNSTEESWVCLKYHRGQSDTSSRYLEKMVEVEDSSIQFSMSPYDYLNVLCPSVLTESDKVKAPQRSTESFSKPVEERYKSWLLEGPPIHRFNALKYLAPEESDEEILRILQKHALLVQGLWVPKSTLVYGKESGVEVVARDYVLSLFNKAPFIKKSAFKDKGPGFEKAVKDILNVLAIERPVLNDWKLKEKADTTFHKLYPKVAAEQAATWERLEKGLHDIVSRGNSKRPGKLALQNTTTTTNSPASAVPDSQGPRTANATLSRTSMSEETREALPKALLKLFKIQNVCSFQQIIQRLREMAVSKNGLPKGHPKEARAAALGVAAPPEELREIISQVAVNIHDVYVLKSSPENPQYDPLRKVVIDLFIADGPNAKLKKDLIVEAAKLQLKRGDISDVELRKVLNELCVSQNSAWLLKRGDGSEK